MPKIFTKKISIIAVAIPLLVVFVFLVSPPLYRASKSIATNIVTAPLNVYNSAGKYLSSKRSLEARNESLAARVAELSLALERGKDLTAENARLKELLAFKSGIAYQTVSAEVIARDPNNWVGSFTLNKGTSHGLRPGAAVCSAKGLVGKVDEAGDNTSLVMLVTHPGFKAGGMLRESRIHGVVEGDGKGSARMIYLPLDADVKPDEMVVTSGFSREFPKGIVIGRVTSVEKNSTGLFKTALITPEANAYDQEEVLCLK